MGYPSLNYTNYYSKQFTKKLFSRYFENINWNDFVLAHFNDIKRRFYLKMNTDNLLQNYKNIAKLKYYQKLKIKL